MTRHRPEPCDPRRRTLLTAGPLAAVLAILGATDARAQSAGAVTITIDDSLGSVYGLAEILIDGEPQGVLSAGCCMYLQVGAGDHELMLRWPDRDVVATFETNGDDTVAFHVTAERTLVLLEN